MVQNFINTGFLLKHLNRTYISFISKKDYSEKVSVLDQLVYVIYKVSEKDSYWIMQCVSTSSFNILVNGKFSILIHPIGVPISLYIFIICAKYLGRTFILRPLNLALI